MKKSEKIELALVGFMIVAWVVNGCLVQYSDWKVARNECLEQARYYFNSWCDDDNQLVTGINTKASYTHPGESVGAYEAPAEWDY